MMDNNAEQKELTEKANYFEQELLPQLPEDHDLYRRMKRDIARWRRAARQPDAWDQDIAEHEERRK